MGFLPKLANEKLLFSKNHHRAIITNRISFASIPTIFLYDKTLYVNHSVFGNNTLSILSHVKLNPKIPIHLPSERLIVF